MANKSVNISSSLLKFTFTDADGDVVAYFRMNPADIRIAERAQEVEKYFDEKAKIANDQYSTEDVIKTDKEIADKIDYILGYKASETLFGFMSATSLMDDGKIFAALVLDTIAENIKEEVNKRNEKFAALSKYTADYE